MITPIDTTTNIHSTSTPTPSNALSTVGIPDAMNSVINVASVNTHIPVTLDVSGSNYYQWSTLFIVFIGKSILDMAERKIANESAVEGSTALLTSGATAVNPTTLVVSTGRNVPGNGGSNSGDQRKKKWHKNKQNKSHGNNFGNFNSRAPSPGGGPWIYFSGQPMA
ncbi:hypothetical protein GUJ93_ZPchr0002g25881 [Zizania palustris]|uniref:Uncharacterized protein n=1 Tax=Zizania palustris TaxID=103762 RepID=A0A8J5VWP5_ZIZPA|nr:hypothetical protein GUJ93_ZPchr0002g25881 [Zizania palustris]